MKFSGMLTSILHNTVQQGSKITNKQLKVLGQVIYSTYDEKCKENFGKSLTDILLLVPEAGLEKKLSPVEKRKLKRDQQRQMKNDVEKAMNENDTDLHLSSRQSYRGRQNHRLAQAFESREEATERARITPPKRKAKSHTTATENIIGDLDQLLSDIKSWPKGTTKWSEKYKIRMVGQDATPPNGGQMIKSFLHKKGVDISCYESSKNQIDPKDHSKEFRVRRALKKQRGGDISVPVPRTNEQIRADIKQCIGGK